jgi:predicted CXXCH cytochrome family protein
MKKIKNVQNLLGGLATICLVFGLTSNASAAIAGRTCDECHTMHNSQGGADMIITALGGTPAAPTDEAPEKNLIRISGGCAGCHGDGTANAAALGGSGDDTPRVNDPVNPLAGGYFDDSDTLAKSTQHDVSDFNFAADLTFGVAGTIPGGTYANPGGQITCSGTSGCHEEGGHHNNNATTDVATRSLAGTGSTAGDSYRFLYVRNSTSGAKLGYVAGIEDADWEYTKTDNTTDHNQYRGENVNWKTTGTSSSDPTTISRFCGGCHGNFHGPLGNTVDSSGTWIRHPTDYAMPTTVGSEYVGYSTYRVDIPVASIDAGAVGSAVATDVSAAANRIVTCLSCHRAHGSDQADLLRFDYSTMIAHTASVTTGCFACHTTKDT